MSLLLMGLVASPEVLLNDSSPLWAALKILQSEEAFAVELTHFSQSKTSLERATCLFLRQL